METRVALIGIIVQDFSSTEAINQLLHQYRTYIIGRMGLPYARRDVAVISIVLDAPMNVLSALSGKLGMLPGVTSKTIYSNVFGGADEKTD
jgi:putative iron-only hydrogenase system regulator